MLASNPESVGGALTGTGIAFTVLYLVLSERLVPKGRLDDAKETGEQHRVRAEKAEKTVLEQTQKYEQLIVVLQGIQDILRQRENR